MLVDPSERKNTKKKPQNIYTWKQLAQGHRRPIPTSELLQDVRKKESQHRHVMMWERKTTSLVEWKNKAHLCNENHKIVTWSSLAANHEHWLRRWTRRLPPHDVASPAGGDAARRSWPCPGVPRTEHIMVQFSKPETIWPRNMHPIQWSGPYEIKHRRPHSLSYWFLCERSKHKRKLKTQMSQEQSTLAGPRHWSLN